jgi:hypothetical protein
MITAEDRYYMVKNRSSTYGPMGQPLLMAALTRASLPILSRAAFGTRSTSNSLPNWRA